MTPTTKATDGPTRPRLTKEDLTHEARAGELIGWLRLIAAPNRSGEVSVNREDAVTLLAVLDGLRAQRDAALYRTARMEAELTEHWYRDRDEMLQLRIQRDAVLAIHRPVRGLFPPECQVCGDEDDGVWPCPTVRAMGVTE